MKKILLIPTLALIYIIEATLVLSIVLLYYYLLPISSETKVFYVPDTSTKSTIKTLKKNDYKLSWIDELLIKEIPPLEKGWYSVENSTHRVDFFNSLDSKKTKTMEIVVFAGETKQELIKRLANDLKLDKEKLLKRYNVLSRYKEGEIIAQRYTVARNAKEKSIITYLFNISHGIMRNFKTNSHTQQDILTIASIIQKESNSIDEMAIISSVIHNRLDKNMKLQMDSTLNHGEFSHKVVTPERIKNDNSKYNTYKYRGLPPTPLSSVTRDALVAAVHPIESDYIFFMLKPNGDHTFAVTYDEHLKNIRSFRRYQKLKKAPVVRTVKNVKLENKPLVLNSKIEELKPLNTFMGAYEYSDLFKKVDLTMEPKYHF